MIYFDNASSTKPSKEVIDAYLNAAINSYENPNSIHKMGMKNFNDINRIRQNFIRNLKLDSQYEVIFTSGATESNNLAILGYARKNKNRGKKIITTKVEHESVLNVFKKLESEGFLVTYLDVNEEGKIDLDYFNSVFDKDTILVSIMPINNEVGFKLNVEEISKIVRTNPKCVLHIDCAQTLGKYNFNYSTGDLITISAHKIYGLKGIGALIKKKKINLEPVIYGGEQENGLRSGTLDFPSIVAFNVALEKVTKEFRKSYEAVTKLHDYMIEKLKELDEEVILHEFKDACPYIVNFSLKTKKASVLVEALSNNDILVSSVSACNSKKEAASYVLKAIGRSEEEAFNAIRISFSKENTIDEIDEFINCLKKLFIEIRGR